MNELKKLFPHGEFNGKSCGLGFSDDISGDMTCVLSMLNTEDRESSARLALISTPARELSPTAPTKTASSCRRFSAYMSVLQAIRDAV